MVFSSSIFLLVFLPLFLLVYFAVPSRTLKNVVLLAASLLFYAWGEPVYVVLMILSIALNWAVAMGLDAILAKGEAGASQGKSDEEAPGALKSQSAQAASGSSTAATGALRKPASARMLLVVGLIANLAILGFFKYEGFLAQNINAVLGSSVVPDLELALPIGISFYTLQAVSYIIDVYRREVTAQRNPLFLGMYIAMFPQLIAGPIVRYQTIQEQVLHRKETFRGFASGARLFIIGLAKKVLLANVVAILATRMLEAGGAEVGALGAWLGLAAYTFQIFFDFSGYSDMATGLGKMCGFEYLCNFKYPYISKSVTEFWRRWHISLSSFFRDYVYISLGGSRCSMPRHMLNLAVVWLLTGFWHGAAWNFVLWGLYYLAFLLIEKFLLSKLFPKLPSPVWHLYTILVFMFGWMIFWIEDMSVMGEYFAALLGMHGALGTTTLWEQGGWAYLPVFIVCILASTPVVPFLRARLAAWAAGDELKGIGFADVANYRNLATGPLCDFEGYLPEEALTKASARRVAVFRAMLVLADVGLLALLALSVASIVSGSFNPFIYFRF